MNWTKLWTGRTGDMVHFAGGVGSRLPTHVLYSGASSDTREFGDLTIKTLLMAKFIKSGQVPKIGAWSEAEGTATHWEAVAPLTWTKRNPLRSSAPHGYVIEALHLGVWSREGLGDKIVFSSAARAEKALRSLMTAYRRGGERVDPKGFRTRKVAERPDVGY